MALMRRSSGSCRRSTAVAATAPPKITANSRVAIAEELPMALVDPFSKAVR